jgi:hypothetical protein
MPFIKKFRNGRPVDPTDPTVVQPLTPPPSLQEFLAQQGFTQEQMQNQIPPPPVQQVQPQPKISAPIVNKAVVKKGCGCGRK